MIKACRLSDVDYVAELDARSLFLTQGALSCLEQASSDAYDQLCKAWTSHTTRTATLLEEVNEVSKRREEAANWQRVAQRAENKQLQVETDKVRPVFVRGVVGNREILKPTVGGAARVDTEVQRA